VVGTKNFIAFGSVEKRVVVAIEPIAPDASVAHITPCLGPAVTELNGTQAKAGPKPVDHLTKESGMLSQLGQ
jgi:hypothetical protein